MNDPHRKVLEQLDARAKAAERAITAVEAMVKNATDELQHVVSSAHAARAALEAARQALHAEYAVPRVIPHNVLALVLQAAADMDHRPSGVGLPPAFVAASVSKRWRDVALSTPAIWTSLRVTFDSFEPGGQQYVDIVRQRARTRPLRSMFYNAPRYCRWEGDISDSVIIDILEHSVTVDLYWEEGTQIMSNESLVPLFMARMPHLVRFTLHGTADDFFENEMSEQARFFTLCPNLRRLDLGCLHSDLLDPASLPALETLTLDDTFGVREFCDIARAMPKLKRLRSDGHWGGAPRARQSFPQADFGNLVAFSSSSAVPLHILASPARVPRLQHLSIAGDVESCTSFGAFLSHAPFASLRALTIRCSAVKELVQTFALLPNLSELRLADVLERFMFEFMWAWSKGPVSEPASLERLHFVRCGFNHYSSERLASLLSACREAARVSGKPALRELQIMEGDVRTFPAWLLPRLEQLVDRVLLRQEPNEYAACDWDDISGIVHPPQL